MSARRVVTKEPVNGSDLFAKKPKQYLNSIGALIGVPIREIQRFCNHQIPIYKGRSRQVKNIIRYTSLNPLCDVIECDTPATVMVATPENKGWCLCQKHYSFLSKCEKINDNRR